MAPMMWLLGAGLAGAAYLLTRKPTLSADKAVMKSGAWYRVRMRTPTGILSSVAETTCRAQLVTMGFRDFKLSVQDPSNGTLWAFIARWGTASSRIPVELMRGSGYEVLSVQEVEEPPTAKDTPPTPSSLDAGMPFEDAVATAYALGRENDPKHLNAFASTLVPDYPLAASLLVARAKMLNAERGQPTATTSGEVGRFFAVAGSLELAEVSHGPGGPVLCGIDPATNQMVKVPVPKAIIVGLSFDDLKEAAKDVASSVVDKAKSAFDELKDAISDFPDEVKDVITSAYDRFPVIKDFAKSKFGETFIRAWSNGLRNSPMLASLGPVGAGIMLMVSVAPLMATYDQTFWEALGQQMVWEAKEAAKYLGAEKAGELLDQFGPGVTSVIDKLKARFPNTLDLITKLSQNVIKAEDLAAEFGVRVDIAQSAIDFLKGQVPDLSKFDPLTGKRKLQLTHIDVKQPASVRSELSAKGALANRGITINPKFASAARGLGKTVEDQWKEFSSRMPGSTGWPSSIGKKVFASQIEEAKRTGQRPEDTVLKYVLQLLAFMPHAEAQATLRKLISKLVQDKKLASLMPNELAKATSVDVRLAVAAISAIGEFPNDIRLVDSDIVRGLLAPPPPVAPAAVTMMSAMSRPGRTVIASPQLALARFKLVQKGAKEGNPEAMKANEELKRANRLLERRKWVEQYNRLLAAEKAGDIHRVQGNLTGSFFGA